MPRIHARSACSATRPSSISLSPPPSPPSTLPQLPAQDNSEQITAFPTIKIALKMLLLLQAPAALPPPPDPRPPAQDSCEPVLICSPDVPFSLSSFTLFPTHSGNDDRRSRNRTAPVRPRYTVPSFAPLLTLLTFQFSYHSSCTTTTRTDTALSTLPEIYRNILVFKNPPPLRMTGEFSRVRRRESLCVFPFLSACSRFSFVSTLRL